MSGRSSIERLPPAVRDDIDALIENGATTDEVVACIRAHGDDCSRSAVGRYAKRQRALIRRRHEFEQCAEVWLRVLGERAKGSTALVALEALRVLALSSVTDLGERTEPPGTEEVARLALALRRIEGADRLRAERERKAAGAAGPRPLAGTWSQERADLFHEAMVGRDPSLPPDPAREEAIQRIRRSVRERFRSY